MNWGNRRIRSAGRTSGSVEITLPAEMQALEGVECRLVLRDGARPEIVLQPDVSVAEAVFAELWERLHIAFAKIGDIGDFSLADFDVGLFPARHWRDKPPLSYQDALVIHRYRQAARPAFGGEMETEKQEARGMRGRPRREKAGPGRFPPEAGVTHVVTFLAVGAAYRLGLEGRFALAFGVVVGYLVSGMSAGHGADFERDVALALFEGEERKDVARIGSLFNKERWEEAQDGFTRVFDRFRQWQENPGEYEAARQKWWEALEVETGVSISTVDEYISRIRGENV